MSRTGRRPGTNNTRAALLDAARKHFASSGYDATSLRTIAGEVGVDPAVILHFFGSKSELFREAVGWPFDPEPMADQLTAPDTTDLGMRTGRAFLETWEDPRMRESLLALLRSAMTQPESAAALRSFLDANIFGRLSSVIGGPQADLRVSLASAQMIGLALLRYIIQVEPLANATMSDLLEAVQPVLSHYLEQPALEPPANEIKG